MQILRLDSFARDDSEPCRPERNTKPAIQYVARGRRPFGPYTFTTGGAVRLETDFKQERPYRK